MQAVPKDPARRKISLLLLVVAVDGRPQQLVVVEKGKVVLATCVAKTLLIPGNVIAAMFTHRYMRYRWPV
jgi:hypothetical protein